jgi:hypothetical protein
LSWPVALVSGTNTLKVFFPNDFWHEESRTTGTVFLDRLRLIDGNGRVVTSLEFEDVPPPPPPGEGQCGGAGRNPATGRTDHYVYGWGGELRCALLVDVEVPAEGGYVVEVVAWADRYDHRLHYAGDAYSEISVEVGGYRADDTWYRDMRTPGFAGKSAPNPDKSVQWLARQIVADERFAEAAVKFWWPAIMGSEVAEPPEDEGDADFEGLLLAATAQGAEVARLAQGFRRGFQGGPAYNLKDLLVEIVLSKWFRADGVESANPILQVALQDAGARRLLTPEELARKSAALTGFQWGRHIRANCWPECEQHPSALTDDYRLLYGGIDSDGITERARDITSVMAGVAKTHAAQVSCPIVMRELYLLPDRKRRLFSGIDKNVTPLRGADTIRNKLLGVRVTPHSPDVESAYRLFLEVWERNRTSRDADTNFRGVLCDWSRDIVFWEGILDAAVVEHENEDGWRWYEHDWDRINDFMDGIDWSDPHYTAQTWIVVLAYLLMDYRYLYL